MIRPLLFRGKDFNGVWHIGHYVELVKLHVGTSHYIVNDGGFYTEVNMFTIGQFTNSLDNSGKKLFEGDIIESDYDSTVKYRVVEWKNYGWHMQAVKGDNIPSYEYEKGHTVWIYDFRIVGNIYDDKLKLEIQ